MTATQRRKILGFSALLTTLGVLATWAAPISNHDGSDWRWTVLVAALYVLAHKCRVGIEFRGEEQSLYFTEIALAVALTTLDGVGLVAAFALVCVSGQFVRPMPLLKAVFAIGNRALEWGVAALVFGLIAGPVVSGPRMWVGVGVAVLAASVLSGAAVGVVISIANGRPEPVQTMIAIACACAAANTVLGVMTVEIIAVDWRGLWMIAATAVGLWFGYRSYLRLTQRYGNLDLLHQFSHRLSGVTESDDVAVTTLLMAKELLRGEIAELIFKLSDGVVVKHVAGDGVLITEAFRTVALPAETELFAYATGLVVAEGDGNAELRHVAERLGWRDLACAPIGAEGFDGMLVVANRLADASTFDAEDLRVLETFAQNTGIALKVGELVDELRREVAEKEFQSLHDALTGLPNRERLNQVLNELAAEASFGSLVAVLTMDLHDFKEVNDTLGHTIGDSLLEEIGRRLNGAVRGTGATVARLGGDEFAVALSQVPSPAHVLRFVETLRAEVEEPYFVDQLSLAVRFSIGVAIAPPHGLDAKTLLQRADIAMYAAKRSVSGVKIYSADLDKSSTRRLSLAGELQPALQNNEFQLFYQPQLELATGRVVAIEALARWPHATHKSVPPDEFIPLVEQSGLIGAFTEWAVGAALRDVALWRPEFPGLRVSVNMSARNLLEAGFGQMVMRLLDAHGLTPDVLTLELTESTVMGEPERSLEILTGLHAMGIRLAIDDFGTGYSSLSYLKRLPVAEVKVDKSFVMNMIGDSEDTAIVRSTIDLARNLGMETVAEGVETLEVMHRLGALGCWAAQGYHLSRPIPAVDVPAKLRELNQAYATSRSTSIPDPELILHQVSRSS